MIKIAFIFCVLCIILSLAGPQHEGSSLIRESRSAARNELQLSSEKKQGLKKTRGKKVKGKKRIGNAKTTNRRKNKRGKLQMKKKRNNPKKNSEKKMKTKKRKSRKNKGKNKKGAKGRKKGKKGKKNKNRKKKQKQQQSCSKTKTAQRARSWMNSIKNLNNIMKLFNNKKENGTIKESLKTYFDEAATILGRFTNNGTECEGTCDQEACDAFRVLSNCSNTAAETCQEPSSLTKRLNKTEEENCNFMLEEIIDSCESGNSSCCSKSNFSAPGLSYNGTALIDCKYSNMTKDARNARKICFNKTLEGSLSYCMSFVQKSSGLASKCISDVPCSSSSTPASTSAQASTDMTTSAQTSTKGSTSSTIGSTSSTPEGTTETTSTTDSTTTVQVSTIGGTTINVPDTVNNYSTLTSNENTAKSAESIIEKVTEALQTNSSSSARFRRQSAKISSCSDFDAKYNEFLDNVNSVSDENIDNLKESTSIIEASVPRLKSGALCTNNEKSSLLKSTEIKVASCQRRLSDYRYEQCSTSAQLICQLGNHQLQLSGQPTQDCSSFSINCSPIFTNLPTFSILTTTTTATTTTTTTTTTTATTSSTVTTTSTSTTTVANECPLKRPISQVIFFFLFL